MRRRQMKFYDNNINRLPPWREKFVNNYFLVYPHVLYLL